MYLKYSEWGHSVDEIRIYDIITSHSKVFPDYVNVQTVAIINLDFHLSLILKVLHLMTRLENMFSFKNNLRILLNFPIIIYEI